MIADIPGVILITTSNSSEGIGIIKSSVELSKKLYTSTGAVSHSTGRYISIDFVDIPHRWNITKNITSNN